MAAQGFFEGNERTAVIVVRWFIRQNMNVDPDELIKLDDQELKALLMRTTGGDRNEAAIRAMLRERMSAPCIGAGISSARSHLARP